MQRLGDTQDWCNITRTLNQIKTIRQLRADQLPQRELLDFSSLTGENLEELNMINEAAPRLTVREIPHCGRCDEGWLRIEGTRNSVKICHYCEVPRRRARRLNDLELPADSVGMHLRRYEWDTPEQERKVTTLLNHIIEPQQPHAPSAFMWGQPGNGKTSLLYSIARWAAFKGKRVIYTSHTNIINSIKDTWGDKQKRTQQPLWRSSGLCMSGGQVVSSPL